MVALILSLYILLANCISKMYYQVEAILDKEIHNGKPWYLVKWRHYPISEATLQPPYTLRNAYDLIEEFEMERQGYFD